MLTEKRHINFLLISKFFGASLLAISGLMIMTCLFALNFREKNWIIFLISSIITLLIGSIFFFPKPLKSDVAVTIRDSFLIVVVLWFCIPFFGAFPFYLSLPSASFVDALFESYAGFTTTGFSILPKYEGFNKALVLWRGIIQWLGGMGIIIFLIAIFPLSKTGEVKVFFSDAQDIEFSPFHTKITITARRYWLIYFIFTLIGFIALLLLGLNWFEALCFTFSSVTSGGSIPYHGDISHLPISVKAIIGILMLIAGANYFFFFRAIFMKKNLKNEEFVFYLLLIFIISLLFIIFYSFKERINFTLVFETIFNTISFVSTTGFYSNIAFKADYLFVWLVLFFLFFIGSSAVSTGGGINIYRIIVLLKYTSNFLKSIIHTKPVFITKLDNKVINLTTLEKIFAFFVLYLIIFAAGSFLLSILGLDFKNAIGFSAASLSNTGPGIFLMNGYINISEFNIAIKSTMILLMLIGRLEIFPILLILSKSFWRP